MRVIVLKKNRANKRGTPTIREVPPKKILDKVSYATCPFIIYSF